MGYFSYVIVLKLKLKFRTQNSLYLYLSLFLSLCLSVYLFERDWERGSQSQGALSSPLNWLWIGGKEQTRETCNKLSTQINSSDFEMDVGYLYFSLIRLTQFGANLFDSVPLLFALYLGWLHLCTQIRFKLISLSRYSAMPTTDQQQQQQQQLADGEQFVNSWKLK